MYGKKKKDEISTGRETEAGSVRSWLNLLYARETKKFFIIYKLFSNFLMRRLGFSINPMKRREVCYGKSSQFLFFFSLLCYLLLRSVNLSSSASFWSAVGIRVIGSMKPMNQFIYSVQVFSLS